MNRRWVGVALLLLSLVAATIMAGLKTFQRVEEFAEAEDGYPLMDRVVMVPPFNSTEGWVGFKALLSPEGKVDYEAYGVILPNDEDLEPYVLMRVVNETGSQMLQTLGTDQTVWDDVKIYGAAYLDTDRLVDEFRLQNVAINDKYAFLFRGLKNETQSRPILISVKEAWYEQRALWEPTPPIIGAIALTTIIGLILTAKKPPQERRKRLRRITVR